MNKIVEKVKFGATVFYCATKKQLLKDDTILISAATGLYQGLKYGGSFKRGIKAGLVTWATLSAVNGTLVIIHSRDKLKEFYEGETSK